MDMTVSRAIAGYAALQKTAAPVPRPGNPGGIAASLGEEPKPGRQDFGAFVGDLASAAVSTLRTGEARSLAGVAGQADVQSVVEALAAAEMTMRTVTAIRDKVVEAYHDILRMPV